MSVPIITSETEYQKVMQEIESYLSKGFDNLADDEEKRLVELSEAAEKWERKL